MRRAILILSIAFGILFLGAGCPKRVSTPASNTPAGTTPQPTATGAVAAPTAFDPFTDDLDAAIEDLGKIE